MKKSTIRMISRRDRGSIEQQMKRYPSECGPVVTYTVDPAVFKQEPVLRLSAVRA